jgi:hypothetical protein
VAVGCARKVDNAGGIVHADPYEKTYGYEALAWEQSNSSRREWSKYTYEVIDKEAFTLIDGADDIEIFCPRYRTASKAQKLNFWAQLIAAISRYESNWNPMMRFHEKAMGIDPITQQPVYSEGLLQLSYQDTQWERRCEFNWDMDKNLRPDDPEKTILNPYRNIRCGLFILERQINKYHRIVIDSGVYWAVIRLNGKYEKIAEISSMTKSLSFCR